MEIKKTLLLESDSRQYEVECIFYIWEDNNYGADADGNRGCYQWGIDDIQFESITNKETGNDIPVKRIPNDVFNKIYEYCHDHFEHDDVVDHEQAMADAEADYRYEEAMDRKYDQMGGE